MRTSTYPRLDLELLSRGPTRYRLSSLVLVTGFVLAMAVTVHYLHIARQIAVIETGMSQPTDTPEAGKITADSEEVIAVKEGIAHLALPWGSLFASLEAAATDKISLISVEPDADKSTIKIVAEAPEVYGMLEYLRALAGQPALRDVLLAEYEVEEGATEQPVRFTLTAAWMRMP